MTTNTLNEAGENSWTIEKLNDRAYTEIKSKILTRELPPGSRLVDSQIAEIYGISRTPVRDAIRKLAEEGLVVNNSKKGYFVFKPTRQDIVEIYELRLILDKAIVTKLITELLTSNYNCYINELKSIEEELLAGVAEGGKTFLHNDEAFHDSLVRLCNNSRITAVYDDNRTQTKGFRYQTSTSTERMEKAHNLHKELLAAIKTMDLDGALRAIALHVEMSRTDALADFDRLEEAE